MRWRRGGLGECGQGADSGRDIKQQYQAAVPLYYFSNDLTLEACLSLYVRRLNQNPCEISQISSTVVTRSVARQLTDTVCGWPLQPDL